MTFTNNGMVKLTLYGLDNNPYGDDYPLYSELEADLAEKAEFQVKGLFAEPLFEFITSTMLNNDKIIRKKVKASYKPVTMSFIFPRDNTTPFEEYYNIDCLKKTHHWLYCDGYNIPLQAQTTGICVKVNLMSISVAHNEDGTKSLSFELESSKDL